MRNLSLEFGKLKFLSIFILFFCVLFCSCEKKQRTIVIWSNHAEIASYIERFNVEQSDVRAFLMYKEQLATEIANASEKLPDIAIGSFLMNSQTQKKFVPLDSIVDLPDEDGNLSEKVLDKSTFYTPLLEYGKEGKNQLLLPVSFNLPIIAFSEQNSSFISDSHVLELEEMRDIAATFNAQNKSNVYTKMGFAPSWNADFIYTVAKMNGADFMEVGRSFGWNMTALDRTVDFIKEWTLQKNTSTTAETDFSFKYLYTPPYKQITSGRCLFTYTTTSDFFSLSPEQIANSDFRWLTSNGEIFIEDDLSMAGILKNSKEKSAAKDFLRWLLREETQQELIARANKMQLGTRSFGFCGGFSAIRVVNERALPSIYRALLGNLPVEESIRPPLQLSPHWDSLKKRVLIPYLSDATKTEPPPRMKTINDRLKEWIKQQN